MHVHHDGPDHSHATGAHANLGRGFLTLALLATLALVGAEFLGGYLGHSVALLSDAVHNLSDIPAIVISWIAAHWAERPADAERTFGYRRAGILAAFTNSILLVLVALALFWEAFERFRHPVAVNEEWMIALAIVALLVNGGITLGLVRGRKDLNLRVLLIHNFGDSLSNIGILVGALIIRSSGAVWLDPALGLVIAGFVLWSSMGAMRESTHILLEGLPRQMRLPDVAHCILEIRGVQEVHDVHIWTLGTEHYALSCHVRIPDMHMEQSEKILEEVRARLADAFGIRHVTVQFERAGLPDTGYYMPEPYRSGKG
jgi:cobalt-zinc-cadmium efflux system protein